MPLKDNWETGDIVTADALNDVAAAVNKVEFDETADDGEKLPAALRTELFHALFTDNGDSTWSVGI